MSPGSTPSHSAHDITLSPADWERLAELRALFLHAGESEAAVPDYWRSTRDLEIYDATFGARIGWKWDAVLSEMRARDIQPPDGTVVDWGAGTGVAARAFLKHFGGERKHRVHLHERSSAARAFATERVSKETGAQILPEFVADPDVLLVSHVIDELDTAALDELIALGNRARMVVWVESGAKHPARALSAARERMLDVHDPLLPCTHRAACGVLAPEQARNWCHHFAKPAPEAFTTAHWRAFSRTLGIDLRALPYAMLVMSRRATHGSERALASGTIPSDELLHPPAVRVVGSGRVQKGRAFFDACGSDGVRTLMILTRTDKEFVRALAEREEPRVLRLETDGDRIARVLPV